MVPFGRRALRHQVALAVWLVLVSATVVGGASLAVFQWRENLTALERRVDSLANIAASRSTAALMFDDRKTAAEILAAVSATDEVELVCAYTASGEMLVKEASVGVDAECPDVSQGAVPRSARGRLERVVASVEGGERAGFIYLRASLQSAKDASVRMVAALVIIVVAMLFVGTWVARRLARSITQPLDRLSELALRIAQGAAYEAPNVPAGSQEMTALWQAFSRLLAEVKSKEDKLIEREQNLALTLNSIGDAVIATDAGGSVTRMNPIAEKLTGWAFADASGKPIEEVMPLIDERSRQQMQNPVREVLTGNRVVGLGNHTTLVARDGREHQVADSAAPIRSSSGVLTGVIMVLRDVTEQYRLRQKMDEVQRRWRSLLDHMPAVAYGKDAQGKYVFINREYERIWGVSNEAIQGQTDYDRFPKEFADQFRANDLLALASEVPLYKEEVAQLADGQHTYLTVKFRVQDDRGEYVVYGISTDITSEKHHKEHMQRSQKMDALGKLTGGIAHDINNLLGIVLGYAERIQQANLDAAKRTASAQEIIRASERGKQLTGRLLAFSRKRPSNATGIDINRVLRAEREMLEKSVTVRIQVEWTLDDALWSAWLDAGELEDAIVNLTINSKHAMPDGGRLQFITRNEVLGAAAAAELALTPGEYVSLSVVDTGVGMDDETQRRMFEPFFTTKGEQGTGLGLAQVYGFVARSGGAIKVRSHVGQGCALTLYFPRHIATSDVPDAPSPDDTPPLSNGETVLVVDDEPALRELAVEALLTQGYRVLSACDAEQALIMMASEQVDVLLSDIILPGMDGYALAAEVSARYPHIKIQLASGFAGEHIGDALHAELHEQRLEKPYRLTELLQRIRRLLDDQQREETDMKSKLDEPLQ